MDSEKPRSLSRFLVRMACVFLGLVLVVYPLSIGPAIYYRNRHYNPQYNEIFFEIYDPLVTCTKMVPAVHDVLKKYLRIWAELGDAQWRKAQNKIPPAEP